MPHIFLQGPLHVGKSTLIRHILALLRQQGPLTLGGFITYRAEAADPHIYMHAAADEDRQQPYKLARYDASSQSIHCYAQVFEETGVRLLREPPQADLILMDELGFLERQSPRFQQAVYEALEGAVPVLGVLREGEIPWHMPIKQHAAVRIQPVSLTNRDQLPAQLAAQLAAWIKPKGGPDV